MCCAGTCAQPFPQPSCPCWRKRPSRVCWPRAAAPRCRKPRPWPPGPPRRSASSKTLPGRLKHCLWLWSMFLIILLGCGWRATCYSVQFKIVFTHSEKIHVQSCQPLCFGRSLLRPRALHYAATLMVISLCSPSEKQFIFIFNPMRLCGHQICQQLVVHVPFCVWDVGCATANRRSRFNQLTNHSVRFNSRSYASLPGETTSVFNHFKSPCRSEKLKASSRVMNLKKKTHT